MSGDSSPRAIEYTYDGNGNRYSKKTTVIARDGNPAAISERYYSYDTSGNIVSEYKRVILNGSEESQTLVRYVRDIGGKAISMIQGSNTYYFTYNGHGDVTSLTDNTGAVVATYSYDEFGNQSSSTGNIYNPLRYSGANNAYYDTETSLYKMGVRYYQPDIARWLTRDKAKFDNLNVGSMNKYVYAENSPINKIDLDGFKASRIKQKVRVESSIKAYDFANKFIRMNALFHYQTATTNGSSVANVKGWRKIHHSKTGWLTVYYPDTIVQFESRTKAIAQSEAWFRNLILPPSDWFNKFKIKSSITANGSVDATPWKWYYRTTPHWYTEWNLKVKVNNQTVRKVKKEL